MTVNGVAAVNTTQDGSLPDSSHFTADEIYTQTGNPQNGSSTPEVVGPPLSDPYAGLTPPAEGDPNVNVFTSTFSPNGQLDGIYILKNGLSMSGQHTISTGPNGVTLYVTGGNVDLTGGSSVVLSNPVAKYSPIVIWVAGGGSVLLGGNSGATTIGGTIYAPTGGVSFGGTSALTVGGVVTKNLDCHGTSDLGVGPVDTTTALTAAPASPSADGQAVTLTAKVKQVPSGIVNSGKVVFQVLNKNGNPTVDCASAATVDNSGTATCTTGPLNQAAAPYKLTAVYQGNVSFAASTSNTINQRVLEPTTTKLTTSAQNLTTGQTAAVTATVTAPDNSTPAGSVTFTGVSCTGSNTKALAGGVATCQTTALAASNSPYTVTGTYAESASPNTWLGSADQLSLPVAPATTAVGLVSSKPTSKPANDVTFTATVSPAPSGGSVNWSITYGASGTQACTSTTNLTAAGVATCTVNGGTLTVARSPYTVTATYSGNSDYKTSTNTLQQQVISQSGSATGFTLLTNTQARKYTATVAVTGNDGGTPTGQVLFYLCANTTTGCTSSTVGATQLAGTLDASGAATSAETSNLSNNTNYCFGAVYQGDANYLSSNDAVDRCFAT
jgi:hypothetical protein